MHILISEGNIRHRKSEVGVGGNRTGYAGLAAERELVAKQLLLNRDK
jgi:hypothetical protein